MNVISGPMLLRKAATDAIAQWKADTHTGPRECPMVIHFGIGDPDAPLPPSDIQHITVRAIFIVLSDPGPTICTRFLFFRRCRG